MSTGLMPGTLRVATANVMLWGGALDGRQTLLSLDSDGRAPLIREVLEEADPDIAGLTEVWSPDHAALLAPPEISPHNLINGPFADGIEGVVNRLTDIHPSLAEFSKRHVDDIIRKSVASDNHTLGTDPVAAERDRKNFVMRFYQNLLDRVRNFLTKNLAHFGQTLVDRVLNGLMVFGSGLQLQSKPQHPIVDTSFIPHRFNDGIERLSMKGTRQAKVMLNNQVPATVMLTHLTHGGSTMARLARRQQLMDLRAVMALIEGPLFLMGDMNIVGDSDEYHEMSDEMREQLGLKDAYREVHPNPETHPGYTYVGNNEFAQKFGLRAEHDERLDYVFYRSGMGLVPQSAKVMSREFEVRDPRRSFRHLSDHFPVMVDFVPG